MESGERTFEKVFSNGDVYRGNFRGTLPHGKGKYTRPDGTAYEGDWEEGKMTGKGQIYWPSGAAYEGDFSGAYLHGFGTFTGSDGSIYKGSWRMNVQHGFGKKKYLNSDIYDGSWREGLHEGSGRYAWNNGSLYIGNWKGGQMCGRGVMKWSNGDLYDGSWLRGLRQGSGCYRFADASYYFGTWTKGLKDGRGMYYPVGSMHLPLSEFSSFEIQEDKRQGLFSQNSSLNSEESMTLSFRRSHSEKVSISGLLRGMSHRATSLDENWSLGGSTREISSCDTSSMLSCRSDDCHHNARCTSTVVYEREYMQGVLIREKIRKVAGHSNKSKQLHKSHSKEAKKSSDMDIFYGSRSCYLMLNLQFGIRFSVGKITPVPMREVRPPDFGDRAKIKMYFPRKGSQFTLPHHSIDFYWKDYCPMVFRNLREMFKLDAAEYMMSICGDDGLRELSSQGKSGSIFYVSSDDRFVIKTLRKSELKVLLKMLPRYYDHVKEHENTLITKIFGVHRIKLKHRKKVRFVVMGNMFCTELRIHHRYDLKGSSYGRSTNKDKNDEGTTLKDLDLPYEFHMDRSLHESLFKQLHLDCMFLESQQIIDYSLLLGLHFRAPDHLKALLEAPNAIHKPESSHANDGGISEGELSIPPKGLVLVTHEPSFVSTAPGPHIRGQTLRAYSVGDKEVDVLLPGTVRLRVQLGVNMPAQANCKVPPQDDSGCAEVELFEVFDVVLYLGIIDVLQEYNMRKKLEHAYKSLLIDPMSVSVAEPKVYSKRFINFLEKVFQAKP